MNEDRPRSVLNHRYCPFQRVAEGADARRALAGRATPFQEGATPQMVPQQLARRESPESTMTVFQRLAMGSHCLRAAPCHGTFGGL